MICSWDIIYLALILIGSLLINCSRVFLTRTEPVFATAAGMIRLPMKEFLIYNALAGFSWLFFWSSIAYIAGEGLIILLRQFFLAVVVAGILVWLILRVVMDLRRKNRKK